MPDLHGHADAASSAIEGASAVLGAKLNYAGAGVTAAAGWMLSNEFFGLAGLAVALAGLLVQTYYRRRANQRLEREHRLRMQLLQRGQSVADAPSEADE